MSFAVSIGFNMFSSVHSIVEVSQICCDESWMKHLLLSLRPGPGS